MLVDIVLYAVVMLAMVSPVMLSHELGHFAAARLMGLHVEQYIVGVGPKLFAREGATGTKYAVCALPLGSACLVGQKSYAESRPSTQLFFKLAGPGGNFLFAGVLLVFAALLDDPRTTVVEIAGGPAWEAGLRDGDRIVSVDGTATERWQEVGFALVSRFGDTGQIDLSARRDGRLVSVAVPIVDWQTGVRQIDAFAALGIGHDDGEPIGPSLPSRVVDGVADTFAAGFATAGAGVKMVLGDLSILNFGGALWLGMLGEDNANLLAAGDRQALSWVTWVRLIALLSIGMGVITLLPGPIVDGSAIISATLSLALRRPISERLDKRILYVGAVFGYAPLVLCITYETMAVL